MNVKLLSPSVLNAAKNRVNDNNRVDAKQINSDEANREPASHQEVLHRILDLSDQLDEIDNPEDLQEIYNKLGDNSIILNQMLAEVLNLDEADLNDLSAKLIDCTTPEEILAATREFFAEKLADMTPEMIDSIPEIFLTDENIFADGNSPLLGSGNPEENSGLFSSNPPPQVQGTSSTLAMLMNPDSALEQRMPKNVMFAAILLLLSLSRSDGNSVKVYTEYLAEHKASVDELNDWWETIQNISSGKAGTPDGTEIAWSTKPPSAAEVIEKYKDLVEAGKATNPPNPKAKALADALGPLMTKIKGVCPEMFKDGSFKLNGKTGANVLDKLQEHFDALSREIGTSINIRLFAKGDLEVEDPDNKDKKKIIHDTYKMPDWGTVSGDFSKRSTEANVKSQECGTQLQSLTTNLNTTLQMLKKSVDEYGQTMMNMTRG